jgi:hypothetical protein
LLQLIINYPGSSNIAEKILMENMFLRAEESGNIPKTDEEIEDDFEEDLEDDFEENTESE